MKLQDNYDVGIYCRLSRDDHNGNLESMSIANQRQVLTDYVAEKGWNLRDTYIDDGYTGTNFDRPDFQRMIKDAENGKIDCIITKDLSRLGRNYVQTGYYTEEYFNEKNIRFIAVNDGIDTMQDNNDIAAFHHVLNEFYPRQVSKKVRQVKKKIAEQGKFVGSHAPYGYMKSPEDRHKLIIDEEAAKIVRYLFHSFDNGESARMIGDSLNEQGISSPRFYYYEQRGLTNPLTRDKNLWGSATITQILRNQAYIGNMVQGKREVISFKTKKVRPISPENWIIVENTHEPLIERDVWDRVQKRLNSGQKRVRKTKEGYIGLFSGMIKCADCGMPLAYMRRRIKNTIITGIYRCSRYNNNGGSACSQHYIAEEHISTFVLEDIRRFAHLAVTEREELAQRLYNSMRKNNSSESGIIKKQIHECEQRISDVQARIKNLYEDKCTGQIPESVCSSLMKEYTAEQSSLEKKIPELKNELDKIQDTTKDIDAWLDLISQYDNIQTLDRSIVFGLIEEITVHEREKKHERKIQQVDITYRFIRDLLNDKEKEHCLVD